MIILRQRNYSKKSELDEDEKKNKKSKRRGRLAKAGAVGALIGGEAVGTKMAFENGIMDDLLDDDKADKVRKKLKIKKAERGPEDSELFEKLTKKIGNSKTQDYSPIGPAYDPKSDTILGLGSKKNADLLSHELGHKHYFKDKDANKIVKGAHKIYDGTGGSLVNGYLTPGVTGVTAGIVSGKRKAQKEDKGEKESKLNKHISWAAPLIASSPMLISEAAASRHGIKSLKESGASKQYLKESKKNLGIAFGTYATKALAGSGIGLATREAAYRKEKRKIKKRKEKENKKD